MSEEMFFNRVRESLADYSPEVPQSVYAGMRRKLWLSRFVQLNFSRMNIWYLLLLLGIGSGVATYTLSTGNEATAVKATEFSPEIVPANYPEVINNAMIPAVLEESPASISPSSYSSINRRTSNSVPAVVNAEPQISAESSDSGKLTDSGENVVTPTEFIITDVKSTPEVKTEPAKKGKALNVKVYTNK